MNRAKCVFWRSHAIGGMVAGIGMLLLAYVMFVLRVVSDNSVLQIIFALPAVIVFPLFDGVCMNQPDDCGFGLMFLSVILGWPVIGVLCGLVVGCLRRKKSHV